MRRLLRRGVVRSVVAGALAMAASGSGLMPARVMAAGPALPDLQVTAKVENTAGPGGAVPAGALMLYTFTIENKGKLRANGATFTASIPAGLALVDDPVSFLPNAWFKVASAGFQWLFDTAPDGVEHSTCTLTPEADGTRTVSCRLGQYSGFFTPTLESGLDILDPAQADIVQFFAWAPAAPAVVVVTGNVSTSNGDARPSNNAVAATFEVK